MKMDGRPDNIRFAKEQVQYLNEALCFASSTVLEDSLVLRNPLLRQAPNHYQQGYAERKPTTTVRKNQQYA